MQKPDYRVPSMAEIRAVPHNGLTVASTFSGCGGSCLGFRWAGFRHVFASEFVPAAADTYRANFPDVPLSTKDVRELDPKEIGEVDVLEGSPPCAAFSTAGKREAGWGKVRKYSDVKQRVDDLFFEFVRLLRGVRPRAFVAENVSGLVKGVAKGYFLDVLKELKSCGYRVEARTLDAQWLGVPQTRQRLIFVGFRDDVFVSESPWPRPLPWRYSLRDAVGDRSVVTNSPRDGAGSRPDTDPVGGNNDGLRVVHDTGTESFSQGDVTDRPCPAVTNGVGGVNSYHYRVAGGEAALWAEDGTCRDPETGERIDLKDTAIGRELETGKYFQLKSVADEDVTGCVTAAGGHRWTAGVVHHAARKFTLAELRRVCGFPDDFALTGTYAQRWERLGRAVPPPMARAVAEGVARCLLTTPR